MSAQRGAREALGDRRQLRPRVALRLLLLVSAIVAAATLASASAARAADKLPCQLGIKGIPPCSTTVSLSGSQLRSAIYVSLAAPPLEMSLPGEAEPWGLFRLLELQLAERLENEEQLSKLSPAVNKEIHDAFEEIAAALKATEPADGKQETSALQGEVLVALDTVSTKLSELLKQAKANGASSAEETLALMFQASREQDKAALREVAGQQFLPNWSSEKNSLQPEEILDAAFTDAEADTSFEALAESILGPGQLPPLNSSIKKLEEDLQEQGATQEAAAAAAGDPSSPDAYTALQGYEGPSAGTSNPVAQISLGQTYTQVATAEQGASQGFENLAAGVHTWVQSATQPSLTKFQKSLSGAEEYLHLQSSVTTLAINAARFFYTLSGPYQAALRAPGVSIPLYGAFVEGEKIAVKDVAGAISKAELLIDPFTAISIISELPNLIMTIINLIAQVPSFEEIQLQQDKQIEEMIKSVSQEIEAGFAEVDAKLDGVAVSLERDTELLEHVGSNISRLRNEMSRLQDSLTELREDIFNIATTQREEGFQVALNTDLGYSTRTPGGAPLPLPQFEEAAGLLYTWATEDPFNYLSENPAKHDLDEAATVLNSPCPELGPQNPLNCNLDFFASIIGADKWGPSISTRLPNPEVWAAGASAYAQLLLENPEYVTKPVLARLQQVESVGSQVPPIPVENSEPVTWLGELTTQGPPSNGEGYINAFPPINTGSTVLNNALLNYELRFDGTANRPSLAERLEGAESTFLSEEHAGEKADPGYCKPCRLAEAPETETQLGNVLIEPWNAEASEGRATCQEGVTTGCVAALRAESREAPGLANVQGKMNECGYDNEHKLPLENAKEVNALTDPVEPYFALAWQLGLGKLLICWQHDGDEQGTEFKLTQLLLKWYWQPTGGAPTEILKFELLTQLYSPESGRCSTGTEEKYYENLIESWGVKGGACYAEPSGQPDLEEISDQVMQKEIAGHNGKLLTGPIPPKTCEEYADEVASLDLQDCGVRVVASKSFISSLKTEVEQELEKLEREMYGHIAPEGAETLESSSLSDPQKSEEELEGARELLADYVAIGLPTAIATDPRLHELTSGAEHLLDNSSPYRQTYEYFHELAGAGSTLPKENALNGLIRKDESRVGELETQLSENDGSANHALAVEGDPLIPATTARLGLTKLILESSVEEEAAPINTVPPEVTGTPTVGQRLRCSTGEWRGEDPIEFSYQWLRDGAPVPGRSAAETTKSTYVVGEADAEGTLSCEVTAENSAGVVAATSKGVFVPARPELDVTVLQRQNVGLLFTEHEVDLPVTLSSFSEGFEYAIVERNTGNSALLVKSLTDSFCDKATLTGFTSGTIKVGQEERATCTHMFDSEWGTFTSQAVVSAEDVSLGGRKTALTVKSNVAKVVISGALPTAETLSASNAYQNTAQLNGIVDVESGTPNATDGCEFEWGEAAGALTKRIECVKPWPSGANPATVQATLAGLAPDTTYYYRVSATNIAHMVLSPEYGAEVKFTTAPEKAPRARAETPTSYGATTATLIGTVTSDGAELTGCYFTYTHVVSSGTSKKIEAATAFCASIPSPGAGPTGVAATVGVLADTMYSVSLTVEWRAGPPISEGEVAFTTLAKAAPSVIAEEASGLSQTAATLNGTVNPQGTALTECKFEYALATSSTFSAQKCETPLPTGSAGPVSAKVSGLSPFAPYKFRLFAKSANGSNTSAEETFVASSLLYPTKTTFGTEFGLSVAISGDGKTAIAGAPGGVTGGAVVYTRSSSGWSQQEVLTPSEGAGFGASAALSEDGEVAVVGAPETPESFTGGVSIFTRSGSSWTETALLNTTCAEFSCDFGSSVSISANGDTAVVGADGADGDVGAAWIFTRSGSTWTQGPKLTGGKEEVGKGYFGSAVSISGDGKTVIVGETGGEEPAAGAWVFTGSGSSWTQQGPMLKAGKDATFGESVSLSSNGSTALIGARGEGNPNVRGAAYVFTRAGSTWSDSQKITPSTQTATEEFGSSVALSAAGSIALIGASGADADGGAAYVFKHSGSKWVLEEPEEFPAGLFGYSVGLSGNGAHAIIGAPGGVGQSGSAWLF